MSLFRRKPKRVALEDQLSELEGLGLSLSNGCTQADLLAPWSREESEEVPYRDLAEAMGFECEREPYPPLCDSLWMCDIECVEGPGSYVRMIERLERMTPGSLNLANIRDHVVQFDKDEDDAAWVSFTHLGKPLRWDLCVHDDWVDDSFFPRYDALLREAGSSTRLFVATDHDRYGQVAFLGAFNKRVQRRFSRLTGIAMAPVHSS